MKQFRRQDKKVQVQEMRIQNQENDPISLQQFKQKIHKLFQKKQVFQKFNPQIHLVSLTLQHQKNLKGLGQKKIISMIHQFKQSKAIFVDIIYIYQKENMNTYFKQYEELQHLLTIKSLVQSEEIFVQTVQKLDFIGIVNIFDAITLALTEHKSLFQNSVKSRKLFENSLLLGESVKQDDALQEIIKIICDCLDCDKAEILILDNEKEELWTKNYKTGQIQQFTYTDDITGICLNKKQTIVVHNAYNDVRFNKENDRKLNYKTDNLLLCPIIDKESQACIGVILSKNKKKKHFNSDDQLFISKLAKIVAVHLRTQQKQDESITIQNSLRSLLEVIKTINNYILQLSVALNLIEDFAELLIQGESQLKNLFHVQKSKIYIVKNDHYLRINEKKEEEKFDIGIGLIGQTHQINEFLSISNAYNHPNFNKQESVDIETSMPVYCFPYTNQKWTVIVQVVNHRGLRTTKASTLDQETLHLFTKIFVAKIISLMH